MTLLSSVDTLLDTAVECIDLQTADTDNTEAVDGLSQWDRGVDK